MGKLLFTDWFEEQHGRRSHDERTDEQLKHAVKAGAHAAEELRRRQEWDARRESALYAWQVEK